MEDKKTQYTTLEKIMYFSGKIAVLESDISFLNSELERYKRRVKELCDLLEGEKLEKKE